MDPYSVSTLTQDLTLQCRDERGRSVALAASFGYSPSDPYAVSITFRAPGEDVRWAVARSLLMRGVTGPTGDGDIHVWPSLDDDEVSTLAMEFRSPGGRLVAEAPAGDLFAFLSRTLQVVPTGSESEHLDIEGLIADLLGAA